MHIGFITYNTLGKENILNNGWHERNGHRAFVIQNSKGQTWGARKEPNEPTRDTRTTTEVATRVADEIGSLWQQLSEALPNLDHLVVYVGSRGSERAIELASHLPSAKVTFVGCDCGLAFKEAMIQTAGLFGAGRVLCECGGHSTMRLLFERFMETGSLHRQ